MLGPGAASCRTLDPQTAQRGGKAAVRISKGTNASVAAATRRGKSRGATPSAGPSSPVRLASAPIDVTSIAGVPESDLTPSVRHALTALLAEVQTLHESLERSQRRVAYLEELADRDALVPVLNRRAFVRELARMISYADRYSTSGALIYFDIDGMKRVNDALGHGAGDAVLTHVANALLANLRNSDIVGRLGGDEFGVILAQAEDDAAHAKAVGLSEAISARGLPWQGREILVRVSFGIYTFGGGENVEEALSAADRAMYAQRQSA